MDRILARRAFILRGADRPAWIIPLRIYSRTRTGSTRTRRVRGILSFLSTCCTWVVTPLQHALIP